MTFERSKCNVTLVVLILADFQICFYNIHSVFENFENSGFKHKIYKSSVYFLLLGWKSFLAKSEIAILNDLLLDFFVVFVWILLYISICGDFSFIYQFSTKKLSDIGSHLSPLLL